MVDSQFRFRDDEPVADPAVTVDVFGEQTNAAAVRIEPGDDARTLLPYIDRLKLVEVNFPVWTDGRGYSAARILREAGYAGELRAVGDVLIDQIPLMLRCGIDSFAVTNPTALKRLAENRLPGIVNHYQPTARPSEDVGSYSWRRRA